MKFVIEDTSLQTLCAYVMVLGITVGQETAGCAVEEALNRMKPLCEKGGVQAYKLMFEVLPELTKGLNEGYLESILNNKSAMYEATHRVDLSAFMPEPARVTENLYKYPETPPLQEMLEDLLKVIKESKNS